MTSRATNLSVLATVARSTCSARLLSLLALFFCCLPAHAAWMSFSHTNYDGTPNTNQFLVRPVGNPAVDVFGNVTATIGLPTRITPAADGRATNWFQQNNYLVTNTPGTPALFLGRGYIFRAPLDFGPTVYPAAGPGMLISGLNYFVNLTFGSNQTSVTYNIVTNALGGAPILSTNLPVLTNGFIRLLDATNVAAATSLTYSNTLYSDYTTRIALLSTLSITNIFPTNAAGVSFVAGRAYVSTNYDPMGTALAIGAAGTNFTLGASNALFVLHSQSLTNIFATNVAGVTFAGGRAYVSTNYDGLGAAAAIGLQSTNYTTGASNALRLDYTAQLQAATNGYSPLVFTNVSQVLYTSALPALTNGFVDKSITNNAATVAQLISATNAIAAGSGISGPTATNINNAAAGVIATNGAALTYKFSSAGTNAIIAIAAPLTNGFVDQSITNNAATKAYAQSLTNGFVDKSITNNAATVAQLNQKAATNSPTLFSPTLSGPGLITVSGADIQLDNGQRKIKSGDLLNNFEEEGFIEFAAPSPGRPTMTIDAGDNNDLYLRSDSQITLDTSEGVILTGGGGFNGNGGPVNGFSGMTNIQAGGISTNGSTAGQVITSIGGKSVWTNVTAIAGAGITNAYGTNFPNGAVVGQKLYYPTNDPSIASNWFQISKLDKTNGFATGATLTNLSIQGNVSMGRDGASTVFLASTNFLAFNNAGSGIVTNGAFVWLSSVGMYTNFLNGATLTNNGSQWLAISNGVTLYSLSGSNPIGTYSAVSGVAPSPTSVYTEAINDHMILLGYWSKTNQDQLFSNATNSVIASTTNNFIANLNSFGTNTYLTNANLSWGGSPANMNFQAATFGAGHTISGSGNGAGLLSGVTNSLAIDGAGVIAGGMFNQMNGGGGNADTIAGGAFNILIGGSGIGSIGGDFMGGGMSNRVNNGSTMSSIVGGFYNFSSGSYAAILGGKANTNLADGGVILGGQSNRVSGSWSLAAGRHVNVSNDNVFAWSDGTPLNSTTNAQFLIHATNGVAINTNSASTNALEVNGWVDSTAGFSINGVPVTAGGGSGAAQSPWTSDIDAGGFSLTNAANLRVGAITNTGLTASTLLQADANKKMVSFANGTGFLTNNGAGGYGFFPFSSLPGSGAAQSPWTSDINAGGFSLTNAANLRVGAVTNTGLTASTLLEADANKKIVSIANAVGALTNDGAGNFGYAPLRDASTLKASQYVSTDASTNFISTLNGSQWTNLIAYTHEGTTTNITATFNGTLQTFTCTNGPSVGQNYYFHFAGANGSISYRFSGSSYNNLNFDYQPKWLAGSNNVITNGVLSLTSYGGTNATQIEAAIRENQ